MNASSDKIQKTNIDIMALLQEICVDANFEFGQMQRVRLEPHPPLFLSINKKLMHRAIENIVRNALYYSPPSTLVIIQVSLQPESESIAICISDEGPGIPDNELKKIFNPFYRVDSSREKRTGGFGLGLSIAERAVFLHEGSITAANHTPRGLAIRIFLPQLSLPKG
jgi:two-component system sensor histidine kinase CpxA